MFWIRSTDNHLVTNKNNKQKTINKVWVGARARFLLVDEGPPLAKVSPKPLDVPGSNINLGRHGCQIL